MASVDVETWLKPALRRLDVGLRLWLELRYARSVLANRLLLRPELELRVMLLLELESEVEVELGQR